ncbi:uncharacterized protein BCR38DRAFT_458320 [Pseudomassariella vexata]|uniref:Zn(2)-C6 fungal-type domain-containing protein n=1 Tax=Pseudomassariella vexata TaxID=1141098 RepID=A0A1Y2DUX2_9PEZI|nr:uncharacterized protein BCR38DRAFT_458320 [Pseudomassariella vexata]ORY63082.1 hypothetical protein BCR38DRAFT_458320 [Pseudomassariella vexata]
MDTALVAPRGSPSQSQLGDTSPTREKVDEDLAPKKTAVRKRTKTGCLTCRKRRIKCDEGRPTCNNCIKSKRNCEGYNQRVIFKDPLGFAPFGHPLVYPTHSPQTLAREQQLSAAQQKASSQSLQIIAPKPPPLGYHAAVPPFSNVFPGQAGPSASPPLNFDINAFGIQPTPTSSKLTFFPPETGGVFTPNPWRRKQQHQLEPQYDFLQYDPGRTKENTFENVSPVSPVAPQQVKGKQHEECEPALVPEPQLDPWELAESDEDASMGESDEELMPQRDSQFELNELGLIVSQRLNDRYDAFGTQARTFSRFAANTVLATYEPSPANSPLNDKQIASVFWHFVNVTGPSISLYERHPFDPSPFIQEGSVVAPQGRQHIWTYTFPVLSFNRQAANGAPTASLRHYHLALRRVARNVGRVNKRTQPSNLAATLLLAYYEVWNSDHEKWSKHLLGARLILKDIPYSEMTRSMMAIKRRLRQKKEQRKQQQAQAERSDPFGWEGTYNAWGGLDYNQPDAPLDEPDPLYNDWDQINVSLLTSITGRLVTHDELGMVPEEQRAYPRSRHKFTEKDTETYEQLSDLFWWYCKMDVYQSILGATKLFMDYNMWTQCPPRAPMGRLDATYGTYDHLMLLLGRLANFASRDLMRKRRVLRKAGTFGPSGAPPGTFPGMMPASNRVPLPMGFSPPREQDAPSPQSDSLEDADLEASTEIARAEWEGIKAGFAALREHFGPEFEPMGLDMYPVVGTTPFGPAAKYRTYGIAGIWMNYYMGMILLYRAHPTMPPVAMMAAGRAARETGFYANEIGRIAAGLEENVDLLPEISTLVGAAFIESAFCLFVAGVQYENPSQRDWVIRRCHDIARLTGWQSARQIADGCESAWVKAASLGRGPMYQRSPDINVDRMPPILGNPRRIDRHIQEVTDADNGSNSNNKIVLAKEEKAHYAMGLLAVEQDLEKLDLDSSERDRG